jgi:hypothetical protein
LQYGGDWGGPNENYTEEDGLNIKQNKIGKLRLALPGIDLPTINEVPDYGLYYQNSDFRNTKKAKDGLWYGYDTIHRVAQLVFVTRNFVGPTLRFGNDKRCPCEACSGKHKERIKGEQTAYQEASKLNTTCIVNFN